jgi:hypothetical protein
MHPARRSAVDDVLLGAEVEQLAEEIARAQDRWPLTLAHLDAIAVALHCHGAM